MMKASDGKVLREWKKAFESDIAYVISEIKDMVETPAMVILSGDLGAGKTTLVRSFSDGQLFTSPTYSLISDAGDIVHADLYRIETVEELIPLELSLYLEGKNYLFVEWGRKFLSFLLREIPEEFQVYEISISINPPISANGKSSRNYALKVLSKF